MDRLSHTNRVSSNDLLSSAELFKRFLGERRYLKNVTDDTIEWCETAWKSFHCRWLHVEGHRSEIVSFTTECNWRSRRVMDRLGMHHDPAHDFDHPALPDNHPLRRHVLYRLHADEWPTTCGDCTDEHDLNPGDGHDTKR